MNSNSEISDYQMSDQIPPISASSQILIEKYRQRESLQDSFSSEEEEERPVKQEEPERVDSKQKLEELDEISKLHEEEVLKQTEAIHALSQ